MNTGQVRVLFTLGVYQGDNAARWASKHKVFCYLARSLQKLGLGSHFLVNRASVKTRFIDDPSRYHYEDSTCVSTLLDEQRITHVFIWGGRRPGDERLMAEIGQRARIIFAEAGWFPQSSTCYFSEFGTNASARLMDEGLREHSLSRSKFQKVRQRILRTTVGFWPSLVALEFFDTRAFNTSKPIFVPLQDETDSNILLSSPVKHMGNFIQTLSTRYKNAHFIVRPHPRASYESLPRFGNVEYQSVRENPYRCYKEYGGVIGINSTMLLQFSLLGLPVAGVGTGIAPPDTAYISLDYHHLPDSLDGLAFDSHEAAKFFDFLLRVKQIKVGALMNESFVSQSYISSLLQRA